MCFRKFHVQASQKPEFENVLHYVLMHYVQTSANSVYCLDFRKLNKQQQDMVCFSTEQNIQAFNYMILVRSKDA